MGNRCQPCIKVVKIEKNELQVKKQASKVSASFYTFGATQKEQEDIYQDQCVQKVKAEFMEPEKIGDSEDSIVSIDETIPANQIRQPSAQKSQKKLKMRRICSDSQFKAKSPSQRKRKSEEQLDKQNQEDVEDLNIQSKYHKWDGRIINQQLQQLRKMQLEQQQQFDMKFQSIGSSKFQLTQSRDMQSKTKTGTYSNLAYILE